MKHIAGISKGTPSKANDVQYFICHLADALGSLLSFKGGASPALDFINDKCDLPGDDTTT